MDVSVSCRGVFRMMFCWLMIQDYFVLAFVSLLHCSNTACCNKLALNDFDRVMEVLSSCRGVFRTRFRRVTIQNYFVLAFVHYGNEESDWTAMSCDAALETDFRSAIGAREVHYTIADLCRGPLYNSRPAVGGRSVYVNYRPALLHKLPYDDVTTIRDIELYIHVNVHVCIGKHAIAYSIHHSKLRM